jgi:hypothetical protein
MQVECPRKLRSGVYVQQAFDRRLTDALWEKACVMSNVHTKLVILELLAKGIIAGDTEPTTYRMLSYKLHAVLIFELIGDRMKTFGI